jgi:uncharacterized membrane protein YkoI
MKKRLAFTILMTTLLALAVPTLSFAISLDQAARQAARQHNAKVLSAQTVEQKGQRVHVIKVLTKDGVVKTVRISDGPSRKK